MYRRKGANGLSGVIQSDSLGRLFRPRFGTRHLNALCTFGLMLAATMNSAFVPLLDNEWAKRLVQFVLIYLDLFNYGYYLSALTGCFYYRIYLNKSQQEILI